MAVPSASDGDTVRVVALQAASANDAATATAPMALLHPAIRM
jgi:hypothetical protein